MNDYRYRSEATNSNSWSPLFHNRRDGRPHQISKSDSSGDYEVDGTPTGTETLAKAAKKHNNSSQCHSSPIQGIIIFYWENERMHKWIKFENNSLHQTKVSILATATFVCVETSHWFPAVTPALMFFDHAAPMSKWTFHFRYTAKIASDAQYPYARAPNGTTSREEAFTWIKRHIMLHIRASRGEMSKSTHCDSVWHYAFGIWYLQLLPMSLASPIILSQSRISKDIFLCGGCGEVATVFVTAAAKRLLCISNGMSDHRPGYLISCL
jgi:hypothetical protein